MRDTFTTRADRVPAGAELFGGAHDGITVSGTYGYDDLGPRVLIVFACGCEARVRFDLPVSWLPPTLERAGRFSCG